MDGNGAALIRLVCDDHQRIAAFVSGNIGAGFGFAAFTAIGLEKDGEIIAGVVYDYYNGRQINAHIAGVGSWVVYRRFLWAIFDYPFNQLKLDRITAPVAECNHKARKLVERMGFVCESVMERASPKGDVCIYRLFREDCKYLEIKHD